MTKKKTGPTARCKSYDRPGSRQEAYPEHTWVIRVRRSGAVIFEETVCADLPNAEARWIEVAHEHQIGHVTLHRVGEYGVSYEARRSYHW